VKRVWALGAMVCLVLGFQNCSQNGLQTLSESSSDVSINVPPSVDGSENSGTPAKVTYVEIPNISDESSSAQKPVELTPYRLVISVDSGEISLLDDSNAVLQKRCLNAGSLTELKTILSGSSVCAATASQAEVCAQSYKPGYASLYVNDKRINLGEEFDSCGRGRKDLCGQVTDVFQAYVDYVKAHWAEMSCQ